MPHRDQIQVDPRYKHPRIKYRLESTSWERLRSRTSVLIEEWARCSPPLPTRSMERTLRPHGKCRWQRNRAIYIFKHMDGDHSALLALAGQREAAKGACHAAPTERPLWTSLSRPSTALYAPSLLALSLSSPIALGFYDTKSCTCWK